MDFEIEISEPNINYSYDLINEVSLIDVSELTYNQFFKKYMLQNVPCVIKNVTNEWQATSSWLKGDKLNFEYLRDRYGQSKVTIYNCNEKYYNSQKTYNSTFEDYLKYWENYSGGSSAPLEYLKDWHLKLGNEKDEFYNVPIFFASDWLNEFYTACLTDDYRFVYMGIKNTWTPFHADVFTSYSWSANIYGRKKWLLFPPGEENHLKDNLGNLPYDVFDLKSTVKCFEITQSAGEVIFVPSGWYHQVLNLEDTVSVNHNWVNGCNIMKMFLSMMNNLEAVRIEIEDCKSMEGFDEHCQVMLNASFGMDYYKFYDFIKYIGLSRMEMLVEERSRSLFHEHKIGRNHVIFDLRAIQKVLQEFVKTDDVNSLPYFVNNDFRPCKLLENVEHVLENISLS